MPRPRKKPLPLEEAPLNGYFHFFYWRHGRAEKNKNTLYIVFTDRENGYHTKAHIQPNEDGTWSWYYKESWRTREGTVETQELAEKKIEGMIADTFRPDTAY